MNTSSFSAAHRAQPRAFLSARVVGLAGLALCSALAAQTTLYRIDGVESGDRLGSSVASIGDVNSDGVADFVVGGTVDNRSANLTGFVRVVSGVDGTILYSRRGPSSLDFFGYSVGAAGDVDGDGSGDFIVGAPFDDPNGSSSGAAIVYSGDNGAVLYTFAGLAANDQFGFAVNGAGDVNGDGRGDLIVGAWLNDAAGTDSGRVTVFSGLDGSVLHDIQGLAGGDNFGRSVASAGDVDGDGRDDLLVGAHRADVNGTDSGTVSVLSGATGAVLFAFHGDDPDDQLGYAVATAGDVDLDGVPDVVAGAIGDDDNGNRCGSARIWSGGDGSVLFTLLGDRAEDWQGNAVAPAGDFDLDGYADVIVGAFQADGSIGTSTGRIRVYSGFDGSRLVTQFGDTPFDRFGWSVAQAGDINSDGLPDLLIGARLDDHGPDFDNGSLYVLDAGLAITPSVEDIYGVACVGGANLTPRMGYRGRTVTGRSLLVTLDDAAAGAATQLFVGDPLGVPLDIIGLTGCTLHANPLFSISAMTDFSGRAQTMIPIANDTAVVGASFDLQWVTIDAAAPYPITLSLTEGLHIAIGG